VSGDGDGKIKTAILKHSLNKALKTKKSARKMGKRRVIAPASGKELSINFKILNLYTCNTHSE